MDDTWDLSSEEKRIIAEYNERFRPHSYRQVFFPPPSGEWKIDASFPQSFFEAAKFLLMGIVEGTLLEGIEGIPALFLARHYLELAMKYTLFHSRWLKDERHNAPEVEPVGRGHDLQHWWGMLMVELKANSPW